MQSTTRSASPRDDIRKLSSTLTRLLMPTWLRQTGVIVGVLILWYWIAKQILQLGGLIRYDGLKSFGAEFVRIMTDINPYLWWGVIAILTLIVLSLLRNWFLTSAKRSKSILVSVAEVQKLCTALSPEAIAVLQWVWDAQADPVTIGDLQATRRELRSGRVRKLAMAQAQAHAVTQAISATVSPEDTPTEPVRTPTAATTKPSGKFWGNTASRTEPVIDAGVTNTPKRNEPML